MFSMQGLIERKNIKIKQKHLHQLTLEEKDYLAQYIVEQKNSIHALGSGVMGGLEAKGITYRASNLGNAITGFPYNLQPWAREYLKANPHLLNKGV